MSKDPKNIELVRPDGSKFTALFSPLTSGRMEKAQKILAGYSDFKHRAREILRIFDASPEAVLLDPTLTPILPLIEKHMKGELTREVTSDKLETVLSAGLTFAHKANNTAALRALVRNMCLISGLTNEDAALIQSEADSEFWQGQEAGLMRDTGENFRALILANS